jgi:hypothetical protein
VIHAVGGAPTMGNSARLGATILTMRGEVMQKIEPSDNEHHWPRNKIEMLNCRKRDLVFRISDWSDDKDEPGYDIECYIGGVYDFNESACCTVHKYGTLADAKRAAIAFVKYQVEKLL